MSICCSSMDRSEGPERLGITLAVFLDHHCTGTPHTFVAILECRNTAILEPLIDWLLLLLLLLLTDYLPASNRVDTLGGTPSLPPPQTLALGTVIQATLWMVRKQYFGDCRDETLFLLIERTVLFSRTMDVWNWSITFGHLCEAKSTSGAHHHRRRRSTEDVERDEDRSKLILCWVSLNQIGFAAARCSAKLEREINSSKPDDPVLAPFRFTVKRDRHPAGSAAAADETRRTPGWTTRSV